MILIQKNIVDEPDLDGDNPQLGFLLSSWERISRALGEFFNPYIDKMMPTLIVLCEKVITHGKQYEEDPNVDGEEDDKHTKFNTYDDDNCLVAINMIRIFLKKRGPALMNWIEPIYKVVVSLLTYLPNDSVRTIAGSCLPPIINCMEQTNNKDKIPQFARMASSELWKTMDIEHEAETLLIHCKTMQELIERAGQFLNEEGLKSMYDKCLEHLQSSHKRKKDHEELKDDEEEDEEVETVMKMETEMEDEFCCQIAEILGKLFLTHKQMTFPIVEQLDNNFISTSLQNDQPDRLKKFGLFLICDIIDHLGEFDVIRSTYFVVRPAMQKPNPLEILQLPDSICDLQQNLRQTCRSFRTWNYGAQTRPNFRPTV